MKPIEIECYFIFNDFEPVAIEELRKNAAPLLADIKQNSKHLHIEAEYHKKEFDQIFPEIKSKILAANYRNVIFNLDQCGHSHVSINVIRDIMSSWRSAEVFLTFMISALLTYLSPDSNQDTALAKIPEVQSNVYSLVGNVDNLVNKQDFLGKQRKLFLMRLKDAPLLLVPFQLTIQMVVAIGSYILRTAIAHGKFTTIFCTKIARYKPTSDDQDCECCLTIQLTKAHCTFSMKTQGH
jgi:hypothetical protein